MSDEARRTKGVQSGPRSRRVLRSVRTATLQELDRAGYDQLTVDGVARAAGVHRSTIYRRWPTKADLVEALLEPQLERLDATPATGSLEDDLVALVRQLGANFAEPEGRALARVLLTDAPELRALADAARVRSEAMFRRAFERATLRGELDADADVEVLRHLAFVGAVHWVLDRDAPPDVPQCRRLVRAVLAATRLPPEAR
ncbi:MAG: TetR/AcrR family transcriptional regulator [Alphaproteobacteria bacterium]|nr:TetR/AcrR family transcriptional regulator [Alphaproteobacteria bacterium]